jgi:hypothetical protein
VRPPDAIRWETVTADQVRVGDDVEVTIAMKTFPNVVIRGTVSTTGLNLVYLVDQIEIPLGLPGTTIRRVRTPMPVSAGGVVTDEPTEIGTVVITALMEAYIYTKNYAWCTCLRGVDCTKCTKRWDELHHPIRYAWGGKP